MKTFDNFKKDAQLIAERFLTRAECIQAYEEGLANGTIRVCEACGSPNLFEVEKFGMTCVDCGNRTNGIVPVREDGGGAGGSGGAGGAGGGAGAGSGASGGLGAGVNSAGSGNVAGIGVGPQGEPGVHPEYQRKRKQLGVVGPPVVDPRMFSDKIFNHGKQSPKPGKK